MALGKLKDQKIRLAPRVLSAAHEVFSATETVRLADPGKAISDEIERGVAHCAVSLLSLFDGIERTLENSTVLALTDEESARLSDVHLLRQTLLPTSADFVGLPYSQQRVRILRLKNSLSTPEVLEASKRQGLTVEVDRFGKWVRLYGARLGLAEPHERSATVEEVHLWHEAFGKLLVRVRADYDNNTTEDMRIHEHLLGPYNIAVSQERIEETRPRGLPRRH